MEGSGGKFLEIIELLGVPQLQALGKKYEHEQDG